MRRPRLLGFAPFIALLGACTIGARDDETSDTAKSPERWDTRNDPAYVDGTFVLTADDLPLSAQTPTIPTPGDYWATYRDSINVRWDGDQPSPAEKYEQAFSKPGVALDVSNRFGIRAQTSRKECSTSAECTDLKDGSTCAIARGETKGRCIPTWWGICPGWSASAYMEPPPRDPVTRNGVTFYPGDLMALLALVYDRAPMPTKFISSRCNVEDPPTDGSGRFVDTTCRDMNPATLHAVLANLVGLRHQGLVVERTATLQVWNQPVRGYRVTNAVGGKLKEITRDDAIRMTGADLTFSEILASTAIKRSEAKTGSYKSTAAGQLIFRTAGTGDADLYVKKGAAASQSSYDCASTSTSASEECRVNVAVGDEIFYSVLGYTDATASLSVGQSAQQAAYTFNPNAKRFYHVQLDLDWITEARPTRTSPASFASSYVRTDRLEYILEANEQGRLEGGEYLGASRTQHPDFMWWPTAKPRGAVPGTQITYEDIKSLLDESTGAVTPPDAGAPADAGGSNDAGVTADAGGTLDAGTVADADAAPDVRTGPVTLFSNVSLSQNQSRLAFLDAPPGHTFSVTTTGTGDVDLYVQLNGAPTLTSYVCKSDGYTASERCDVRPPAAGGLYQIMVYGFGASNTVTAVANIN